MTTLIVTYTPNGEKSKTKQLINHFIDKIEEKSNVEVLDLLQNTPEFFTQQTAAAYGKRNYGKMELDENEAKSLQKFDAFTAQFKLANVIVFAFPMYNFGLPGAVKTYLDMVMLKGETWNVDAGGYVGLMKHKKLLTIFTSAGVYEKEDAWDGVSNFMNIVEKFLGFDEAKIISAQGTSRPNKDEALQAAMAELTQTAQTWY